MVRVAGCLGVLVAMWGGGFPGGSAEKAPVAQAAPIPATPGGCEPNRADEPLADAFSLARAVEVLDREAVDWQRENHCLSCHASYAYLMARPRVSTGSAAEGEVRKAAEELAVHPRESHFVSTEAVMVASALAVNDSQTTGRLHPATRRALERLWELQREDGSWEWLHNGKPPSEYEDDFGVALAAIAVGAAPEGYAETPAAQAGLERMRGYFRKQAAPNLFSRALRLLASANVSGILTAAERDRIVAELRSEQLEDGGWCLGGLGHNWKRADGRPQVDDQSDGYGTGLVVYVLRSAGVPVEDGAVQRGVGWLKAHQRRSGRWFTPSLEKEGKHYLTYPGTAYAVMALVACGQQ